MVVTKDTIIGDILDEDFDAAPYFLDMGMHCLGCPASRLPFVKRRIYRRGMHGTRC